MRNREALDGCLPPASAQLNTVAYQSPIRRAFQNLVGRRTSEFSRGFQDRRSTTANTRTNYEFASSAGRKTTLAHTKDNLAQSNLIGPLTHLSCHRSTILHTRCQKIDSHESFFSYSLHSRTDGASFLHLVGLSQYRQRCISGMPRKQLDEQDTRKLS